MTDGSAGRRVAWLAFGRWKRRFLASARVAPATPDDLLYICQDPGIGRLDEGTGSRGESALLQKSPLCMLT